MEHPELPFLSAKFLEAMNDLMRYGYEKYGPFPEKREDHVNPARVKNSELAHHAQEHFAEYLFGIPHDHFDTRRHQLAAVAINAMMEFQLAGLETEE